MRMIDERVRSLSRIELRDLSLHYAAIAGMAAEVAADRASEDDLASLVEVDARADLATPGGARRAVGRFQLEIAAVSQSPRLVHEELRLQAEAGPLLWLCLREQDSRDRSRTARARGHPGDPHVQPERARRATTDHIASAVEWLIDEKVRLEQASQNLADEAPQSLNTGRREAMSVTVDVTAEHIARRIASTIDPSSP